MNPGAFRFALISPLDGNIRRESLLLNEFLWVLVGHRQVVPPGHGGNVVIRNLTLLSRQNEIFN